MKNKNAIILAAGMGTRMGIVGQILPKVLWPVLDKRIIDLQIKYVKDLGVEKIYINSFFLSDQLVEYVANNYCNENIFVVREGPLLDVGGAIHNVAQMLSYHGDLLVINGDQFLFADGIGSAVSSNRFSDEVVILFGLPVKKTAGYNEIVVEQDQLVNIVPAAQSKNNEYFTYSGVSIVNLEKLAPVSGVSRFFESVADYKNHRIRVVKLKSDDLEYWDFGTRERYYQSASMLIADLRGPRKSKFSRYFDNLSSKDLAVTSRYFCENGTKILFLLDGVRPSTCVDGAGYSYQGIVDIVYK